MRLSPEEPRGLHVLTLHESGRTAPTEAGEALQFAAGQRRCVPRPARPTVGRRGRGADIFTDPLGGHIH